MEKVNVLMSGLPGKMATLIAQGVQKDERCQLVDVALTGREVEESVVNIGSQKIKLFSSLENILKIKNVDIAIDFTAPAAVNLNADFYCQNNIPFIMGTTKGNREDLIETVKKSSIPAVIAPNMAGPIVGFMAMIEWASKNFPNLFEGYELQLPESHQEKKKGRSGTASAMVNHFQALGAVNKEGKPFSEEDITSIRDKKIQREVLGVPEEHLDGHGWHTYRLTSPDGNVLFSFTHNVNGRGLYVPCTLQAIFFLQKKVEEGQTGVFSMADVLKG